MVIKIFCQWVECWANTSKVRVGDMYFCKKYFGSFTYVKVPISQCYQLSESCIQFYWRKSTEIWVKNTQVRNVLVRQNVKWFYTVYILIFLLY